MNEKCPICSGKLIHGYIKTKGEIITWSPNPKRKPLLTHRWQVYEDEIKLCKYNYLKGGKVDAYKCDNCNKIIIDIEQKK